ncbi:MAG: hypothetical protein Q9216_003221 [Gyalolechia sp. 2 TL-2023]
MARPHGTYAKLLPYLHDHWAMTTCNTDILRGTVDRSPPDVRDTLKILEQLHDRVAAATTTTPAAAPLHASLHCRYLYMILHHTPQTKIPHSVFHEIDGVLGTLRKSCVLLQEKSAMDPVPPGFAALVLHLEMRLSRFLAHVVCAIHNKKRGKDAMVDHHPFSEVKYHRGNLVAHIRRIDACLENGELPTADKNIDVVAQFPAPEEQNNGLWTYYRDNGNFAFKYDNCLGCMVVPDIKVRMAEKLGYVPDI